MCKELKIAIIGWLYKHRYSYNRENECINAFREYIYNKDGYYLIGGTNVLDFIGQANNLLYSDNYN